MLTDAAKNVTGDKRIQVARWLEGNGPADDFVFYGNPRRFANGVLLRKSSPTRFPSTALPPPGMLHEAREERRAKLL